MLEESEICGIIATGFANNTDDQVYKSNGCQVSAIDVYPLLQAQEEATSRKERESIGLWLNANLRDHFALHSGMWKLRRGKSPIEHYPSQTNKLINADS